MRLEYLSKNSVLSFICSFDEFFIIIVIFNSVDDYYNTICIFTIINKDSKKPTAYLVDNLKLKYQ